MHTVLIVDDELIIRQGLKCIIEWDKLGFKIIGEASNGKDALDFILQKNPDVVMMDIRIPKLSGLEVVEQVRQKGYLGKIITLSGFSDFKYAQQAIRFGVEYYLTKPIDEDELTETILKIGEGLDKEAQQQKVMTQYLAKVRNSILSDLLEGTSNLSQKELIEINLYTEDYQVVIYEKYSH